MAVKDKRRNLRNYRRKVEAAKYRAAHSKEPTLCCFCGEEIDLSLHSSDGRAFTLEHTQPLSEGGHITRQVLLPCHRGCNTRKFYTKTDPLAGKTRDW